MTYPTRDQYCPKSLCNILPKIFFISSAFTTDVFTDLHFSHMCILPNFIKQKWHLNYIKCYSLGSEVLFAFKIFIHCYTFRVCHCDVSVRLMIIFCMSLSAINLVKVQHLMGTSFDFWFCVCVCMCACACWVFGTVLLPVLKLIVISLCLRFVFQYH